MERFDYEFCDRITDFYQLKKRDLYLHSDNRGPTDKMVHYKLVKTIINVPNLIEVIINMVVNSKFNQTQLSLIIAQFLSQSSGCCYAMF